MAIPTFEEFYFPILKLLSKQKTATTNECYRFAFDYFKLSDEEKSQTFENTRESIAANRLRWANMSLRNAGLMENISRGIYRITAKGRDLIDNNANGFSKEIQEQILADSRSKYTDNASRIFQTSSPRQIATEKSPTEIILDANSEINAALTMQILDTLYKVDPFHFEKIVLNLLINMDYGYCKNSFKTTKKTNDQGIDGIVFQDRLGFDRIYVQAKRYKENSMIGGPEMDSFGGTLSRHKTAKGIFITTSDFNKNAKDYAEKIPYPVILINGETLAKLMIEYDVGVTTEHIIKIKKLDNDYYEEI